MGLSDVIATVKKHGRYHRSVKEGLDWSNYPNEDYNPQFTRELINSTISNFEKTKSAKTREALKQIGYFLAENLYPHDYGWIPQWANEIENLEFFKEVARIADLLKDNFLTDKVQKAQQRIRRKEVMNQRYKKDEANAYLVNPRGEGLNELSKYVTEFNKEGYDLTISQRDHQIFLPDGFILGHFIREKNGFRMKNGRVFYLGGARDVEKFEEMLFKERLEVIASGHLQPEERAKLYSGGNHNWLAKRPPHYLIRDSSEVIDLLLKSKK